MRPIGSPTLHSDAMTIQEILRRHRWTARVLSLIVAVSYSAILLAHANTRKPWNDEAMSALAGYNLAYHGHTGVGFYDEQASGFAGVSRHSYYIFPFQPVVLALWYRLVPFTLLATRVLAMLWACVMLAALYYSLRKLLGDAVVAIVATVLSALDYHVMAAASFGRYDSMVAALGFSAYALYLGLRERHLRGALLASNIAVVAAGATHPNGLFYFCGLWLLVLYFDRSRIGWKDLLVAAIPYVVGGIAWGSFILQDYPSFRAQIGRNSGGRIGLFHPWQALINEIQKRYIAAYGLGAHSAGHDSQVVKLKALSLIAYLFGIVGSLTIRPIRTNPVYRPLFALAALHVFMMTFWDNYKFSYYLVHLVEFYWALAAIAAVFTWRTGRWPRVLVVAGLGVAVLVQIGGILAKVRINDFAHSYAPAVAYVKQHASETDVIFAACSFGFGYGFPPQLIDDDTLGYSSGRRPDFIVLEEIYDLQHDLYKVRLPATYSYIQQLLKSYTVVYHNREYRIYRKSADAGGTRVLQPSGAAASSNSTARRCGSPMNLCSAEAASFANVASEG